MKLRENTVVKFVYDGGTTPGAERQIVVSDVGATGFAGIELSSGLYKNYTLAKARGIQEVIGAKVVRLADLPKAYTSTYLVSEYTKEGFDVKHLIDAELVVAIPKPKNVFSATAGSAATVFRYNTKMVRLAQGSNTVEFYNGTRYDGGVSLNSLDNLQKVVDFLRS
jgi:hypothetical protein